LLISSHSTQKTAVCNSMKWMSCPVSFSAIVWEFAGILRRKKNKWHEC
jgi:hypothetical protein